MYALLNLPHLFQYRLLIDMDISHCLLNPGMTQHILEVNDIHAIVNAISSKRVPPTIQDQFALMLVIEGDAGILYRLVMHLVGQVVTYGPAYWFWTHGKPSPCSPIPSCSRAIQISGQSSSTRMAFFDLPLNLAFFRSTGRYVPSRNSAPTSASKPPQDGNRQSA